MAVIRAGCTGKQYNASFCSYSIGGCDVCCNKTQAECAAHGSLPSQKLATAGQKDLRITYAITSFPDEVQLCMSSIPGEGHGVCAKQHIPVGTWIGPYEGRRVRPDDVTPNMNTSYMWEASNVTNNTGRNVFLCPCIISYCIVS